MAQKKYWLMKSEPSTYSLDDLKNESNKTDLWEGVRNYQARNFIRDMKKGDLAFFYHSNCKVPGIVGIVEITKEFYPDPTAFDQKSPYYDIKSTPDNPRWSCVDVTYKKTFKNILSLTQLKEQEDLNEFALVKKGNRLSIMPVPSKLWHTIVNLAN